VTFRPLHSQVVVRRIEPAEKTAGGIIIPGNAHEKSAEGEVLAVEPGSRNEQGTLVALDLRPGDRVLFGKWSATEAKIDRVDLLLMRESDILGVIEASSEAHRATGKGRAT
jgi:chaperonin GroES